jgi:hypothetical protein
MVQLFFGPDESPLTKPEDVIPFLGKRGEHWNKVRSAYQTAYSWFNAQDLPNSIREILKTDSALEGAILKKAIFEKKTKFDAHGRESQTDVLATIQAKSGLAILGIEAKVDESFGPLIHEWNDYSLGKMRRLLGLLEKLKLTCDSIGCLRYQLLHRTIAAVVEARESGASIAVVLVQSFDKNRAGFMDFVVFANAFGTPITQPGQLSEPKIIDNVAVRLGWTENPMYLADR